MANNLKGYDAFQVIRSVYDVDKNCLRICIVDPTGGGPGGGIEVIIDHENDSIRLGDGTKLTTATQVGTKVGLDVNVITPNVDIRDLDVSRDNVAIHDQDGDELSILPDGSIITRNTINTNVNGYKKYNLTSFVSNDLNKMYQLYLINKRKLGSPPYPKKFFQFLLAF